MNELSKKIVRIQRLIAVEQSQLDSRVAELAVIEARLNELTTQRSRLTSQLATSSDLRVGCSLDACCQTTVWMQHLQTTANNIQQQIAEIEIERDALIAAVVQQKTKVRGWETMQDRLAEQASTASTNSQSAAADDRHLQSRMAR